jgi:uncharacterized protein YprB with RNaseH-like and TPR domain
MLECTFQITPGIGPITEKKFWDAGIRTWQDVLIKSRPSTISQNVWMKVQKAIPIVKTAYTQDNLPILQSLIPNDIHWRMIPHFLDRIAYLDIETTGFLPPRDYSTAIAVYDGKNLKNFIHHQNIGEFPSYIAQYPAVVTFFGKGFDLPFLRSEMHLSFPQIHFDLCFLLRRLGLRGGLKRVEHAVGLTRGDLEGVDGNLAVILWYKFLHTKDPRFLDTLLAYNSEDVLNLEYLLYFAYNGLVQKEGLPVPLLPMPNCQTKNPFNIDVTLIKEILFQRGYFDEK